MFGTFGQQNPFDISIPNTFCQSQGTVQPVTFGQQPTTQPVTFGHPQNTAQPVTFVRPGLTFGQPTAQPVTFGHPQNTAQPVTFVRPRLTTALTFGQSQPTKQALTFGQSQPTPQALTFGPLQPVTQPLTFGQSVTFGQSQPTAQALTFGQSQPTTHPLNETATIHEYFVPKTIVYARVVYDIGTRQNYDHMSGEEYLLQNDLSLSIDYCEKIQRELQKKNRTLN